mgnify:FL=1
MIGITLNNKTKRVRLAQTKQELTDGLRYSSPEEGLLMVLPRIDRNWAVTMVDMKHSLDLFFLDEGLAVTKAIYRAAHGTLEWYLPKGKVARYILEMPVGIFKATAGDELAIS